MKLYYDDPIIAAYMSREFGVVFYHVTEFKIGHDSICWDGWPDMLFVVHPDSYSIFEPKAGDWRCSPRIDELYYHKGELDKDAFPRCTEILTRQGKHFFMAKSEEAI